MHYFLLGPSGVGKTTFGDWLQDNRQYHHLAVDRGDQTDGLTAEGLIGLWNNLLPDPAAFARELHERAGLLLDAANGADAAGPIDCAADGAVVRGYRVPAGIAMFDVGYFPPNTPPPG